MTAISGSKGRHPTSRQDHRRAAQIKDLAASFKIPPRGLQEARQAHCQVNSRIKDIIALAAIGFKGTSL